MKEAWCGTANLLCGVHTGINAVLFYAPVIFTALGASQQAALLSAVAVSPAVFNLMRCLANKICDEYSCSCKDHRQMQEEESCSDTELLLLRTTAPCLR